MGTLMGTNQTPKGLPSGLRWLFEAPAGLSMDVAQVREIVSDLVDSPAPEPEAPEGASPSDSFTWRERLWLAPAETRIGVQELMEAMDRPKSWVYRHTSEKAAESAGVEVIPHRRLDGSLVFIVGEVRAWIRDQEEGDHHYPMESAEWERRPSLRVS